MDNLHFLIIHDNGKTIDEVKSLLSCMGYSFQEAGDAETGLEMAQSGDFSVVIIDVMMPNIDGIEVLKRLVSSFTTGWIIAFTDSKVKERVRSAIDIERCTCLNKPLDLDELRLQIKKISEVYFLRKEVSDKTKMVSHLEVINEISTETLLTHDEDSLLWNIARLINKKLYFDNVNIFLADEHEEKVVLKAFAGGFGEDLCVGYSLKLGEGIVGWVAKNREPLLAGDVRKEPRRIQGFAFEENVFSELAVPLVLNGRVFGVLHVESVELNAFSSEDLMVLKTVADQMALSLEKQRLSRELLDAYMTTSIINDSLPVSIVVVDRELQIKYVNRTFCNKNNMKEDKILCQPFLNYFPKELAEKIDFTRKINEVFGTGIPAYYSNLLDASEHHVDKVLNISFVRVQTEPQPRVMILIQDITEISYKTQQLWLLREISIAMQGVIDRDILLHMILTSVTAGFAIGLNRAFLFLVDKEKNTLMGVMGVAPRSRDEAYHIWHDLSSKPFTFQVYMEKVNKGEIFLKDYKDFMKDFIFDLKETRNILTETVATGKPAHIINAWEHPGVDEKMRKLIAVNEFVTIPLIAKNEVIGVLLADNAYSGNKITEESIEVLSMFASTAALAIENANMLQVLEENLNELKQAYVELEKTHDMLIQHEKLAAIGEMSARVAHEIKNPLATIGGFAESIPRKYDDRERTIRNANIIVEEVRRLENILSNILDFTRAGMPQKNLYDVNELIKETVRIMEVHAQLNNVLFVLEFAEEKIETELDKAQIKQVLINVIHNAINAMPEGGVVEIKTERCDDTVQVIIRDTGTGIPEEFIDIVFDPFFTTHVNGTGLGLPISQKIIQNHNGKFEIKSKENEGTTVSIQLPLSTIIDKISPEEEEQ